MVDFDKSLKMIPAGSQKQNERESESDHAHSVFVPQATEALAEVARLALILTLIFLTFEKDVHNCRMQWCWKNNGII